MAPSSAAEVTNQKFTETEVLGDVTQPPSLVLYQPCYPISEADFLRLQQASPVLASISGGLLSFGCAYALPLVVQVIRKAEGRAMPEATDWWVVGAIFAIGLGFGVASILMSRERRKLLKAMRLHFLGNPAKAELRGGRS